MKKAKEIEISAEKEIKKLMASGHNSEAEELKKEEAAIKKMVTDLEAATAEADIMKIEKELKDAETKIKALIKEDKEIKGSTTAKPSGDKKKVLMDKAKEIEISAEKDIKKLMASGHNSEAEELKKQEEAIKKMVTELEAATAEADIMKIEKELKDAETKIKALIKEDKEITGSTQAHKATTAA